MSRRVDADELEQPGRGRVLVEEILVGDDADAARLEAGLAGIACAALDAGDGGVDAVRAGGLQPRHVPPRRQLRDHVARGPGGVEDRLVLPDPGDDDVVEQLLVLALHLLDQPSPGADLLVDEPGAGPALVAPDQIGLAVSVVIEQRRDLGAGEVVHRHDAVLVGGGLVDEVAEQRAVGDERADRGDEVAHDPAHRQRGLQLGVLQREPAVRPVVDEMGRRRREEDVGAELLLGWGRHGVSQLAQQRRDDLRFEIAGVPVGPGGNDADALSGLLFGLGVSRTREEHRQQHREAQRVR